MNHIKNNYFKIIIITIYTLFNASLFGAAVNAVPMPKTQNLDSAVKSFFEKYAPPKEICEEIDLRKKLIPDYFDYYGRGLIPGFFLKDSDIYRVINATKIRNCITKYNLDCLDVAQKCLYYINDEWRVFATLVKSVRNEHLTLKEVQQLAKLIEETGFSDFGIWQQPNILRDIRGKLVFIDTESNSFDIPTYSKAQCLARFRCFYKKIMAQDALDWLNARIDALKDEPESLSIINSTKFNDPDINFQAVRQYITEKLHYIA